jgi:hypothetical protein
MNFLPILSLLCACTILRQLYGFSFVDDVLKPQFHKNFVKSCKKYPFTKQFSHRLKNPNGKVVVFVFQEQGQMNGGFGDRIAGLITAVGLALRYDRTLIIRAHNDFSKLFLPYTSDAEHERDGRYQYNLSTIDQWAKYHSKYENNNETELDLWHCVNSHSERCIMYESEPSQPNLLYRGNRAYICHWYGCNTTTPAKEELMTLLGSGNDDLLEAAGCMLRLAMWPTELLWSMVDEVFESHKGDLKRRGLVKHHDKALLWRYLVSTHFRCGDMGYKKGQSYEHACQHSYQYNVTINGKMQLVYNIPPHPESSRYMSYGTPIDIARCAARVLENMTSSAVEIRNDEDNDDKVDHRKARASGHHLHRVDTKRRMEYQTIVHLVSDNPGSTRQMNETLNWPNTLLSPSGCHVDLDSSYECLRLTSVYWFIMANSDIIVAPTEHHLPFSGFSGYAAVYGLKENSLRDPLGCDSIIPRREMSHIHHRNWACY